MSSASNGEPLMGRQAYRPIRHYSDYEEHLRDNDLETKLQERYNAFPRVTFAMGMCMLMVGFQWMVQQLREEHWFNLLHVSLGGGEAYSPRCYVNKKCSYNEDGMGSAVLGHNQSHVLSNLVYIAVGLLTGIYACYRRAVDGRETDADAVARREEGLYTARCRGMYVNASVALMVEGCLSGLYHICPTSWNNQFDYVGITMVCLSLFLMLWSKRHPLIISVGTWAAFFGCTIVLCALSALDARHEHRALNLVVWGLCLAFYFLFMPRLLFMLHYGLPFVMPCRREREQSGAAACWAAVAGIPVHTRCFFLSMWASGLAWFGYCLASRVMLTAAIMKYSCGFLAVYMMLYIVMESREYRARQGGAAARAGGYLPAREPDEEIPTMATSGTQEPGQEASVGGARAGGYLPAREPDEEIPTTGMPGTQEPGQEIPPTGMPGTQEPGEPAGGRDEEGTCSRALTLAMAVATGALALTGAYYFCNDVYKTTVSPGESEARFNKPCALYGLDNHDLWHLCSGIALGGVIVVSTRLEDLSRGVRHDELEVF